MVWHVFIQLENWLIKAINIGRFTAALWTSLSLRISTIWHFRYPSQHSPGMEKKQGHLEVPWSSRRSLHSRGSLVCLGYICLQIIWIMLCCADLCLRLYRKECYIKALYFIYYSKLWYWIENLADFNLCFVVSCLLLHPHSTLFAQIVHV